MGDKLELKQNYLREEIIEKGYDPAKFTSFLEEFKGDCAYDLNNWTMEELKDQVKKFKLSLFNNEHSFISNKEQDKETNTHQMYDL